LGTVLSYIAEVGTEGKLEVSLGDWSSFRSPTWEMHLNSYAGEFAAIARQKTQELLNSQYSTSLLVDSERLRSALALCKLYSDRAYASGSSYHVDMSVKMGQIRLQMRIPDIAEVDEPVEVKEVKGVEFEGFGLHPGLALEALAVMGAEVEIRFFGPQPFLMLDPNDKDYCYLQVAMAPSQQEERPEVVVVEEEGDF
jgi:hypothetical protein